ncbi:hypothetical protein LXL04_013251 [Taraxacum kok-saghyz]
MAKDFKAWFNAKEIIKLTSKKLVARRSTNYKKNQNRAKQPQQKENPVYHKTLSSVERHGLDIFQHFSRGKTDVVEGACVPVLPNHPKSGEDNSVSNLDLHRRFGIRLPSRHFRRRRR